MTTQKKPEISYPCSWQYTLLGTDITAIKKASAEILAETEHSLVESKKSSTGKYVSVHLELDVISEVHRDSIFFQFREHIDIKFVI
jgi:putative lipoic acid-binding regulatory protein